MGEVNGLHTLQSDFSSGNKHEVLDMIFENIGQYVYQIVDMNNEFQAVNKFISKTFFRTYFFLQITST